MSDTYISLRPGPVPFLDGIEHAHITLAYLRDVTPQEVIDTLPEGMGYGATTLEVTGAGVWKGRAGQGGQRPPYWISYFNVDCVETGKHLRTVRDSLVGELYVGGLDPDESYDFTPHITRVVSSELTKHHALETVVSASVRFTVSQLYVSAPGKHDQALSLPL